MDRVLPPSHEPARPSGHPGSLFDGRAEQLLMEMRELPPGDPRRERLREKLVLMHTQYVRNIVNRYRPRAENAEDLEQAAMLGLVKAINGFDPDLGPGFLPYASLTVRGEVKRHFRDRSWVIHVPRRVQELRLRMRRVRDEFTAEHGRAPTVPELARLLGADEEEIIETIAADSAYQPSSLDAPVNEEGEAQSLGEVIGDSDGRIEGVVDHEALKPLMARLPERERTIVQLRFWGNLTQAQIADRIGVSQMHVSRLLARTLAELRAEMLGLS